MDYQFSHSTEQERAARRAQRAAQRKRRRRQHLRLQCLRLAAVLIPLLAVCLIWYAIQPEETQDLTASVQAAQMEVQTPPAEPEPEPAYTVKRTAQTAAISAEADSQYAVVIDLANGTILAEKAADTRINPASMTKILTLLVAVEQIEKKDVSLDDTFTMTLEVTDYCYVNECSVVGFLNEEVIPIRDLLYGTILPSGADAALGLAYYLCGSQEAFVELMNAKLEELGLSDTAHFTNCVGLYDEAHSCTVTDMALILKAAMENDLCREVLSTHIYHTQPTAQHPEGQDLSNWFLRKIEDHVPEGLEVVGGKTGYVVQSGNCAASWAETSDGSRYLCVTGNAHSSWRAIYDHVALYTQYCLPETESTPS